MNASSNDPWAQAQTVPQLLQRRAAQTPGGVAFQHERSEGDWLPVSWLNFTQQAQQLSRALLAAGLRHGDRLALIAPVSLQWELLHHAALAMGVVVVGMDTHDLPERVAAMAALADVDAIATTDPLVLAQMAPGRLAVLRFVLDVTGAEAVAEAGAVAPSAQPGAALVGADVTPPAINPSADPNNQSQWPMQARRLLWAELMAMATAASPLPTPPVPDDIASIIFTSGTTGAAKGVAYTHGQLCLAIRAISQAFAFIGGDGRSLCWLPLSNLFQRMVNLAAVRQGAATYLLSHPRRVMQVVATVAPDLFVSVPRFYEKLHAGILADVAARPWPQRAAVALAWGLGRRMSRCRLAGRTPPLWLGLAHRVAERAVLSRIRSVMGTRLQCMVSGSAPISQHLLEEFHALGWLVLEAYGLSENVLPMAMNRVDDFRFGSVGRPLANNDIVIDADGAIKVRGAATFSGYVGAAERSMFDAQGYYLTGDIGRYDSDGYLYLSGRSNELIKTSTGRRISTALVEGQLRSAPGIDQALVIGRGRKHLVALCTCVEAGLDAAAQARIEAGLRECIQGLSEHERPLAVGLVGRAFALDRGELTPNMKLRRVAIEDHFAGLIEALYQRVERGGHGATLIVRG